MDDTDKQGRRETLNRFLYKGGRWYVESREGLQGPFYRREEAVAHLEKHKRKLGWKRETGKRTDPPLKIVRGD